MNIVLRDASAFRPHSQIFRVRMGSANHRNGFSRIGGGEYELDACTSEHRGQTRRALRKDSREIARKGGAMISSEVQRTLVKSPPELWAEISDPESLARHLGEFGEIHITRVQPEQKVEWEAGDASGTVVIKPSGWGTKVKLTVTRELAETVLGAEDNAEAEMEQEAAPDDPLELDAKPTLTLPAEPASDDELDAEAELADEAELDYEPQLAYEEPEQATEPEPELVDEPEPEAHRGFFARLFGRRRARNVAPAPVALTEPEPADLEQEQRADGLDGSEQERVQAPEPADLPEQPLDDATAATTIETEPQEPGEEHASMPSGQTIDTPGSSPVENETDVAADPAAEPALAEELAAAEVTAVLTGVLDRLGAAHHRPFSRA
jgi:hypothetical protein